MRFSKPFILLFFCWIQQISHAQPDWDEQAFLAMSPGGRYQFVHEFPFWKMDTIATATALNRMLDIALEKNDHHTALALRHYQYIEQPKLKLSQEETDRVLSEMEAGARENGFGVEEVVAHYNAAFEHYYAKKITHEQMYVEVQKTFERLEAIGFEQFRDYATEGILFNLSQFMWELEDYEKAFQYLSVAERFVQPTEEGSHYFTLVLNYLQTYWQRKKDFPKAIGYAKKILQFHQNLKTDHPNVQWRSQFWQGFSSLDIAAMLIEQGNFTEGERYADQGYELSKVGKPGNPMPAYHAEYDAMQVLIPIKLRFGKLDEAAAMLQRSMGIKKMLDTNPKVSYFKHLKLYRHFALYYEMRGDSSTALRCTKIAQTLQDSLDRRNDARKFEKIQQRLEAEKYTEQLRLVESEKELQKWLRNATLVILALLLALAFGFFRRQQYLRRQKEAELEAAKNDLAALTQGFREKSELVENLRLEMDKLSARGERSQYLEQLTHSVILTDEDWTQFRSVFEKVHPDFMAGQKAAHPDLTPAELRLLVLEKLGLDAHEMANMLGVSVNTVYKTGQRLRKKIH